MQLLSEIIAGIIIAFIILVMSSLNAAIVFKEHLSPYLNLGFNLSLIGACFGNIIARWNIFSFSVAHSGAIISAVFALVIGSIASITSSESLLPTIFMTSILATVVTGIFLLLMGFLKLSYLMKFLPYPIVEGFLLSGKWLLITNALTILGVKPSLKIFDDYEMLAKIIVAAIFALALFAFSKKLKQMVVPTFMLIALGGCYFALWFFHIPLTQAREAGWLFQVSAETSGMYKQFLSPSFLTLVDWSAFLAQFNLILMMVGVSIFVILFNYSSFELLEQRSANIDQALKITGGANVVSGLFGAFPAGPVLSTSLVSHTIGAHSYRPTLVAGLVCTLLLFMPFQPLPYIPRFILSGLCLYVAIGSSNELLKTWRILPKEDLALILVILFSTIFINFLSGIGIGLFIAILSFIFRYSQVDIIRDEISGNHYLRHISSSYIEEEFLQQTDPIQIVKLQGYLFFGTATRLVDYFRQFIDKPEPLHKRFFILDLKFVSGMDASAIYSLFRIIRSLEQRQFYLIFTEYSCDLEVLLKKAETLDPSYSKILRLFPTLNQSVKWCEQIILNSPEFTEFKQKESLEKPELENFYLQDDLKKYLEKVELTAGDYLFRPGDRPDCIYFIAAGKLAVLYDNKESFTIGSGFTIGEVGFYLNQPRKGSVIAEETSLLYKWTRAALELMEVESPALAQEFHKKLIIHLSHRISYLNDLVAKEES